MVWYRCGGGGIPSSLKSNMNDVFNKKFGTVLQNYPPEDWPGTVNLMGPLPERTVSGAVASFADGADDVPLKSCAVTIAPTLEGVSSVDVVHAHKSLINFVGNVRTTTSAGLTMEATISGGIRMHGTTTQTYAYLTSRFDCFLKAGATYTFSIDASKGYTVFLNVTYDDNTSENIRITSGNTSKTFTPSENIVQIRLETSGMTNDTAYDDTILMMVETGATATDFEKYVAPTTHTAALGRTIYGGSVDVVNGTGTDGYNIIDLGDLTWTYDSTNTRFNSTISDIKQVTYVRSLEMVCSDLEVISDRRPISQVPNHSIYNGSQTTIHVKYDEYTDPALFKTAVTGIKLVYPIATPETFSFTPTPINSRLGDNTMWSDDGDLSVTYRRDIDLALAQ